MLGTTNVFSLGVPSKRLLSHEGGVQLKDVTEVREEQSQNSPYPMLVTELGMVMEVRAEQSSNAPSSMLVTELGRVMEVREEQL